MAEAAPILDIEYERRQLIARKLSEVLVEVRSNPDLVLEATLTELSRDLLRLMPSSQGMDEYFWRPTELAESTMQYIDERRKNKGLPGFYTGYQALDNGLGGWERENIYTLNARSGVGKTTQELQFAWNAAEQTTVLVFSPEARAKMLGRRLICSLASVPNWMVRRGEISDAQAERLARAAKEITTRPIFFFDLPGLSIKHMDSVFNKVVREHAMPELIIVDYLQQMEGEDSFQTITNNMKELETFTVRNKVATLLASQIARSSGTGSEQDAGKGSGKIEELSSVVMGLTKIKRKDDEAPDPNDKFRRKLHVLKNREEGEEFVVDLIFNQITGKLEEENYGA